MIKDDKMKIPKKTRPRLPVENASIGIKGRSDRKRPEIDAHLKISRVSRAERRL